LKKGEGVTVQQRQKSLLGGEGKGRNAKRSLLKKKKNRLRQEESPEALALRKKKQKGTVKSLIVGDGGLQEKKKVKYIWLKR